MLECFFSCECSEAELAKLTELLSSEQDSEQNQASGRNDRIHLTSKFIYEASARGREWEEASKEGAAVLLNMNIATMAWFLGVARLASSRVD